MAWEQLSVDRPHLAYLILGGFTSLFMLCSLFVKEKLYIGEATIATICGVIFGPHAANLFNPNDWGNTDKITLECSRIVLVVQCFAVGVELPKAYMERHWRSVSFLLVPVMTVGWLLTSLFIWWMIPVLTWLESLAIAACVTATDPVLASSVVGKGKFARRVPRHLRDLLSAESGCNDGMAFPFIYLSLYLIKYHLGAEKVMFHWFCFTILYECIFGAVYGFLIGYIGRHLIKLADSKSLIDRESFLVFYFVLALFCAGSGSTLGLDDLLVGFAAGVGFSNDGWFTQKTEESHVSDVIDLLLNLAYFVFLGAIIPWEQYNNTALGLTPWRLVVIALLVVLFRRMPIMFALKPLIPDIKNWREALFAGHFGPIGVGAIFAAVLLRAELQTDSTEPLAVSPEPGSENYLLVSIIWPVVTFLVITSIIVHGSSVAVFTLGKRINTLSITMSYTQANESNWLNRLPRISSTSRSMSRGKSEYGSTASSSEKLPEFPPGTLPPVGLPGSFLRRQREEENPSNANSRASSQRPARRRKWDARKGPGGPISLSAIAPQRRQESTTTPGSPNEGPESESSGQPIDADKSPDLERQDSSDHAKRPKNDDISDSDIEVYSEGDDMIVEDKEGNILSSTKKHGRTDEERREQIERDKNTLRRDKSGEFAKDARHPHTKNEGEMIESALVDDVEHPRHALHALKKRFGDWRGGKMPDAKAPERHRGPAHAYQYGNTIIVEDEDGEVVKKYDIPVEPKRSAAADMHSRRERVGGLLKRMGTWKGQNDETSVGAQMLSAAVEGSKGRDGPNEPAHDDGARFTIASGGHRLSKKDFIKQIQALDPKARCEMVEGSDAPEHIKASARTQAQEHERRLSQTATSSPDRGSKAPMARGSSGKAEIRRTSSRPDRFQGGNDLSLVDSNNQEIPFHSVSQSLSKYAASHPGETAAQRRRRAARKDSDDDGTPRVPRRTTRTDSPTSSRSSSNSRSPVRNTTLTRQESALAEDRETHAERRRRLAALGEGESSDSEDDGEERRPKEGHEPVSEPAGGQSTPRSPSVRWAEPRNGAGRVQWGEDVRGRRSEK